MVPDFSSSQRGYQEGSHLSGGPPDGAYPENTPAPDGVDFNNFILEIEPEPASSRSEEHTSELQSLTNLVCRLLLEKKKQNKNNILL